MHYRDGRKACRYATRFTMNGQVRQGTILNASRSGMLVRLGLSPRRGQQVSFSLTLSDRTARVVRIDGNGQAGLRLDYPLSQKEFREILSGPARGRNAHLSRFSELR